MKRHLVKPKDHTPSVPTVDIHMEGVIALQLEENVASVEKRIISSGSAEVRRSPWSMKAQIQKMNRTSLVLSLRKTTPRHV